MTSPLRVALRDRLTAAMRAHDRQTAGAMRSILAALENAEAVPVTAHDAPVATSEHIAGASTGLGAAEAARRVLSPDDERAVVEREIAELRSSAAALATAGQHERSTELVRIAETVEAVVPG
ncbi:hypothetical protein [Nocardioides soli]|uniref:GatB/YqeY domain-containing protein n=1 Tax=Nocardioides soli TaxID=1036020 RepID=A0A7W4Z3W4_9ACTN|nr:hypothetical protein [Nocardioides soli]MBB3045528.1 hypothetical protein [Nocardioides soli]